MTSEVLNPPNPQDSMSTIKPEYVKEAMEWLNRGHFNEDAFNEYLSGNYNMFENEAYLATPLAKRLQSRSEEIARLRSALKSLMEEVKSEYIGSDCLMCRGKKDWLSSRVWDIDHKPKCPWTLAQSALKKTINMPEEPRLSIEDMETLRNACGDCGVTLTEENRSHWSKFYGDGSISIEICNSCHSKDEALNNHE